MHLVLILLWLVNFPFQPFATLMSSSPSSMNCYIFWRVTLFKLVLLFSLLAGSTVHATGVLYFNLHIWYGMMATQSKKKKKNLRRKPVITEHLHTCGNWQFLGETTCISLLALNTLHKYCYIGMCVWQITITVLYIFSFWELYVASTFVAS